MPTCRDITEVASDYLEGRVSWADWAMLRLHFALCPPCREYVEQLGLTVEALRSLDEPPPELVHGELLSIYRAWRTEGAAEE